MSNQPMTIIGFDPSLRNWGYCIATFDETNKQLEFHQGGVLHSKPDDLERQNLKDLQSATQLYNQLKGLVNEHKPKYLVAELPVGSQSSRAMVSYATCICLSAVLAYADGSNTIPLLTVTPNQVKVAVGKRDATKDEVINWVTSNYPNTQQWLKDVPKTKQEHICDAIVATHIALLEG